MHSQQKIMEKKESLKKITALTCRRIKYNIKDGEIQGEGEKCSISQCNI